MVRIVNTCLLVWLIVAFIALPTLSVSHAQSTGVDRFDGEWKFKLRMRGGNVQCDGVEWKSSTVSGGKIVGELYHGQVGSIPLTGTVSSTGQISITAYNGFVNGSASGQVVGDTASGKFDARIDIENCRGNWTAARIEE